MLNSDAVVLFLAVMDHGSFSAAARHLGKVPSAVSMGIAQIEAEIGAQLFDRSSREPVPTHIAYAIEPQARAIISSLGLLIIHAQQLSLGLESKLSIAIEPELQFFDWANSLRIIAEKYPSLQVEMIAAPQADALNMLHSGRVQLALSFERSAHDPRESFEKISIETLIMVMSSTHGLTQLHKDIRREDLALNRQIVVASRDIQLMDKRLLISRQYWLSDNYSAALTLILSGLGWGFIPLTLAQPFIQSGRLKQIEVKHMSNTVHLWVDVVWSRKFPQGLAATEFVRLMTQNNGHVKKERNA